MYPGPARTQNVTATLQATSPTGVIQSLSDDRDLLENGHLYPMLSLNSIAILPVTEDSDTSMSPMVFSLRSPGLKKVKVGDWKIGTQRLYPGGGGGRMYVGVGQ